MKKNFQKGFTLVEILTALGLFLVVMTISLGAILSIFNANNKVRSQRAAIDNLGQAIEALSREMKFGKNYHCGSGGDITQPQSCPSGSNFISFLSMDNIQTTYRSAESVATPGRYVIEKSVAGGPYIPETSPEINITDLTFYVIGADPFPDILQPKSLIKVQGYAGSRTSQTSIFLQTVVSQRALDR